MRKWVSFLLCLLFSAGIWLIHNMSQSYSDLTARQVVAESNITGRAQQSSGDVTVSARINSSGFHLLALNLSGQNPVTVRFNEEDFVRDPADSTVYIIHQPALSKYSEQIFGSNSTVESFVTDELRFRFAVENHKKVPVKVVQSVYCRPQYMTSGGTSVTPDSVTVYGDPAMLGKIESVLTKHLVLTDLKRNTHGTIGLEVPGGIRISNRTVTYSVNVTRYVELASDAVINARNVPKDVEFTILPSSLHAVLRCVFPITSDPFGNAEFYIDYRDFENSTTGKCAVHTDLPDGVIDCRMTPEVCECLIRNAE